MKENFFEELNKEESNENNVEKQELSPEQKKVFGESWTKMVVDNIDIPKNIEALDKLEVKEWLFESIMKDIKRFSKEIGIEIDSELADKIKGTEDLEKKSSLELDYIKKMHSQVDQITKGFDRSGDKSTSWDSWPKRMREKKSFNCVGATLIGISLLEKANIESYYGNPSGHVLNIVKLSNGEWWYVDFNNGKENVIKINPEEDIISGMKVLKINQKDIEYKLIPIRDNSEIPGSVIGNLSWMEHEVEDDNIPSDNIAKKQAVEFLEKYEEDFKKNNFPELGEFLYPENDKMEETEEMKKEEERIKGMRLFGKLTQEHTNILTTDDGEKLVSEMKDKNEYIGKIFYQNDFSLLSKFTSELQEVLEVILKDLEEIKKEYPEAYQEAIDKIVGKIKS